MGQPIEPSVGCVFCGILASDVPASFVYEDALTAAFLDVRPMTRGHALVVPRQHRQRLDDLDDLEGPAMWSAAQRIAKAAQNGLHALGANLLLADGSSAGQEVDHVHLHVIPRYRADDLAFEVSAWNQSAPERHELRETALLLAAALSRDTPQKGDR
jgi:diadenosine tetraphosphate (Ap4A) HIT family hydrolase